MSRRTKQFKEAKPLVRLRDERDPFGRFFGVLKDKFWDLMWLNLLQFACSLPAFAFATLLSFWMGRIFGTLPSSMEYTDLFTWMWFRGYVAVSLQLIVFGPLHTGFIYLLTCYSRGVSTFMAHDFFRAAKNNIKQSVAATIIDTVLFSIMAYVFMFFFTLYKVQQYQVVSVIMMILMGGLIVLYAMMHIYIYPMMVMVDLPLRHIYSNSLRLAIAKVVKNTGILLAIAGFGFLISLINFFVFAAFGLLLSYSLTGLLSTFFATRQIDKYVVVDEEAIKVVEAPPPEKIRQAKKRLRKEKAAPEEKIAIGKRICNGEITRKEAEKEYKLPYRVMFS